MAPFDRSHATFYWSAIVYIALVPFSSYLTLNNIVTLKSGSLKVIKIGVIRKLGVVSYSPSIATMAVSVAVCEIFSVKDWCDLENRVRVRSRSLEMAPFDRSHTSSFTFHSNYGDISCTVCEI